MKTRNTSKFVASVAAGLAASLVTARHADAVPILGQYLEDLRCDPIPNQVLTHELGDASTFPLNEAFLVNLIATPHMTVCVPDDGVANDWLVQITNISGIDWQDLFFVCDLGATVGNADGGLFDVINGGGLRTDAFRIDGTVTITGMNDNLISEVGGPVDEIFQNGEIWTFNVSNFVDALGLASPPVFLTPGQFADSSPPGPVNSNASILANPYIPEPSVLSILGFAGAAMLLRRPRRA